MTLSQFCVWRYLPAPVSRMTVIVIVLFSYVKLQVICIQSQLTCCIQRTWVFTSAHSADVCWLTVDETCSIALGGKAIALAIEVFSGMINGAHKAWAKTVNSSLWFIEITVWKMMSPNMLLLSLPIIKNSCLFYDVPVTPVAITA